MIWEPIESAPKDWSFVIDLWCNGERYPDCQWSDSLGAWVYYHAGCDDYVEVVPTHWMKVVGPDAQ